VSLDNPFMSSHAAHDLHLGSTMLRRLSAELLTYRLQARRVPVACSKHHRTSKDDLVLDMIYKLAFTCTLPCVIGDDPDHSSAFLSPRQTNLFLRHHVC
jgi:hypothetical protein